MSNGTDSEPMTSAVRSDRLRWEQIIMVCALVGTSQMTWGALIPALPQYALKFGASALLLGLIVSSFGVGRLLVNIPAGMLLQRVPARALLLTVTGLLAAVTLVTGFLDSVVLLVVARFVAGVLGGAAVTIGLAVLTQRTTAATRGSILSTVQAVQLAGAALGPVLGGVVLTVSTLPFVFVVAAVPLLLVIAWALVRPDAHFWSDQYGRDVPPGIGVATGAADQSAESDERQRLSARRLAAVCVLAFGIFFVRFGGDQSLIPLLAYDQGKLTPLTLGLAYGLTTVVSLLLLPWIGRRLNSGHRVGLLVIPTALAAGLICLYPLADMPWFFGGLIVSTGVLSGIGSLVPGVLLADQTPRSRVGTAMGVFRSVGDVGAVVGPLVLGAVLDGGGAGPATLLLAAVSLAALAGYFLLSRQSV
ncbi:MULTISPECIES: MFS transporter [Subtercola]|uniref:MFS transporter n=1 Tax=Subtercola vilae TaxID=2056433 RepID=A0A4T2BXJ8_9MICO|nr:MULTISPECIES: MFS transporter [Subtercola]MEA9984656.1 MFS transporter [Subtercola sp. RTI3]TIH35301.1 MFS transporter [Subtercola vilae]